MAQTQAGKSFWHRNAFWFVIVPIATLVVLVIGHLAAPPAPTPTVVKPATPYYAQSHGAIRKHRLISKKYGFKAAFPIFGPTSELRDWYDVAGSTVGYKPYETAYLHSYYSGLLWTNVGSRELYCHFKHDDCYEHTETYEIDVLRDYRQDLSYELLSHCPNGPGTRRYWFDFQGEPMMYSRCGRYLGADPSWGAFGTDELIVKRGNLMYQILAENSQHRAFFAREFLNSFSLKLE